METKGSWIHGSNMAIVIKIGHIFSQFKKTPHPKPPQNPKTQQTTTKKININFWDVIYYLYCSKLAVGDIQVIAIGSVYAQV